MALTRPFLKGMGLTEEQIGAIIEAHTESTDALKAQRDEYKTDAEKLKSVMAELDDLKSEGGDWQGKYEKEHADFEQFKADVEAKALANQISDAYKKLLVSNHVGESHIDSILRVTDFGSMQIGEDGKIVDESKIVEDIKSKWSGFIISSHEEGASVETPPAGGNTMTKETFAAMSLNERMEYANAHPAEVAGLL